MYGKQAMVIQNLFSSHWLGSLGLMGDGIQPYLETSVRQTDKPKQFVIHA